MAVLDTNFLIALEQREEGAISWLRAHRNEEHFVPDFVAVEYLTGHTDEETALDLLDASFTIPHGDLDWIRTGVSMRKSLRSKKVRFRAPDFWIATWARHHDTSVVTKNRRHFEALDVPVQTW